MIGSWLFQSTQPSQAVTNRAYQAILQEGISIHTALAGCDAALVQKQDTIIISIHTALAGCDQCLYP